MTDPAIRRILILGADGFIGRHIAFHLRDWIHTAIASARRTGSEAPFEAVHIAAPCACGKAPSRGTAVPGRALRLYRTWFALGWPALLALAGVFWLMIARPDFA
jgi:nucleoside-diphosphate-sugar epimerase